MPNNKVVLITRPNNDPILNFLFVWTESIVKMGQDKGLIILDLKGNKAKRTDLESYIRKKNPGLIVFNGHGTKKSIHGYNDETLVELSVNEKCLEDSIIYARSCESAKELGAKCKARAFIGYEWKFVFYYYQENVSHPIEDKLAKRFLDPSNLIATTLLKGKTAKEANNRSKSSMLKNYFEMVSSKGSYEEQRVASFLWSNIAGQRLYGNPEAHI